MARFTFRPVCEDFRIRRDDFLIEQAKDAISDAKLSFWYFGGRRTPRLIVLQNLHLPQQKFIVQINILRQERITRYLPYSIGMREKL